MKAGWVSLFALLAFLTACAAPVSLPDGEYCEHLHPRLGFCLLAPEEMGVMEERLDRVTVETPEETQSFVGQLAVSEGVMQMAAQSLSGVGLFRVRWDGEEIDADTAVPIAQLEATHLVALLQVGFAPSDKLNAALLGGRVSERDDGEGRERELVLDDGRSFLRVRHEGSPGPGTAVEITAGLDEQRTRIRLEPLE